MGFDVDVIVCQIVSPYRFFLKPRRWSDCDRSCQIVFKIRFMMLCLFWFFGAGQESHYAEEPLGFDVGSCRSDVSTLSCAALGLIYVVCGNFVRCCLRKFCEVCSSL